jgi:hypothetical protein
MSGALYHDDGDVAVNCSILRHDCGLHVRSACARIARAQITIGVMFWPNGIVGRVQLSLPRTLGAMRGHKNSYIFQWIKAEVELLTQRHWAVSNQSGDARC